MKVAGLENRPLVLLLRDNNLHSSSQFEDISNLMNNGEIPNIFPHEEKTKIVEEISDILPNMTPSQRYSFFL